MNMIKILPAHEALKIAAGEVVERPANIVKELVENALDADATQITLHFEKAGKQRIKITDNGSGMSPQDAELAIVPHATSKIESLDQLTTIDTFGFRGEALASINAISKCTITTKTDEDELGTKLSFEAGRKADNTSVAHSRGTSIVIEDLFFNTPVRKKFLKRDETEWNQIMALVHAFCLSNTPVHFKVYHNGKLVLNAPQASSLKDRVAQVWGASVGQNMIEMKPATNEGGTLTGCISGPHFWRYSRQQIYVFVNKRYVKVTELSRAMLKGYRGVIPEGKFPAGVLFIEVDPQKVDVNVHPKKEEVRFSKPGVINNLIKMAVTQTLEAQVNTELGQPEDAPPTSPAIVEKPQSGEIETFNFDASPFQSHELPAFMNTKPATGLGQMKAKDFEVNTKLQVSHPELVEEAQRTLRQAQGERQNQKSSATDQQTQTPPTSTEQTTNHVIIGQLLATYILIESNKKLILIDQHAAHERILYEQYVGTFEKKEGTVLLFPQLISLRPEHLKLVLAEQEFFSAQGISLSQFSDTQLSITSTPPGIANSSLVDVINEAATFIEEHHQLEPEVFRKKLNEHVHSHMACKAAVKAGDVLEQKQMRQLVDDLMKCNNRFICVHGRPTMWPISQDEIEKKFRRK